jgi:L-seryl-tRNA(Ser) seleniumtransferase
MKSAAISRRDGLRANQTVFDCFGVPPTINCCGIYTDLGGSILSKEIWTACTELNGAYIQIVDLMESAGARVAKAVGANAAWITPGASAALTLAVAATMTGCDGPAWERLPDTTGLKDEVLISTAHLAHYKYAGCARLSGAALIPAGLDLQYNEDALLGAVGPKTACILVPAHLLDGFDGVEQLASLTAGAHSLGIPVVVDAAYMCFPIELMRSYAAIGADITCFSAKYFGGPNPGGFVAGRAALVEAVKGLDFTRFESGPYRSFGRPFKMSRYDIAATALALEAWTTLDHNERWSSYRHKVEHICQRIEPILKGRGALRRYFTLSEQLLDNPDRINCLVLEFPRHAAELGRRLAGGDPVIAAVVQGDDLIVVVEALLDGQEELVAGRLMEALCR